MGDKKYIQMYTKTLGFRANVLLSGSMTVKALLAVPWEFLTVHVYTPGSCRTGIRTGWFAGSFIDVSCVGSGKRQLYDGAGFPEAVQLRSSGPPSGSSSSSSLPLGKVGGT